MFATASASVIHRFTELSPWLMTTFSPAQDGCPKPPKHTHTMTCGSGGRCQWCQRPACSSSSFFLSAFSSVFWFGSGSRCEVAFAKAAWELPNGPKTAQRTNEPAVTSNQWQPQPLEKPISSNQLAAASTSSYIFHDHNSPLYASYIP